MKRSAALVALILFGSARAHAQLSLHRCSIAGTAVRCGSMEVAEDRAMPSSRRIRFSVFVVPHVGDRAREPLLILSGGPGQAATVLVQSLTESMTKVRRSHDLIFIDQRGTGGEERLTCAVAPRSFFVAANRERCITRLSRIANLARYSTDDFVEDLEETRKALGIDRVSLYGISYGTRAAYVYARRYPEHVQSLVLLAAAPIAMPILDSFAEDGQRALDAVVRDCLSEAACAAAFPNLKASRPSDSYHAIGIQLLQYSSDTIRMLPLLLSRPALLDDAIARVRERLVEQLALGVHLSIICNEDLTYGSNESLARQEYRRACEGWPKTNVQSNFHDMRVVDRAALVITGEWDPVTPPRWAQQAAAQFSRSQVFVIPRAPHVVPEAAACIDEAAAQFLESGKAQTSCFDRVKRGAYARSAP